MNDLIVKPVDVLGSSIMAAKDNDGQVWAGVSFFCKALGMNNKQRDTQVEKVQNDKTISKGTRKFPGGSFDPANDIVAIKVDFIPLWLAKIQITKKMEQDHPELADKLLEYQLKAKDILAEAFMPKQTMPQTTDGKIALLAQGHTELKAEVDSIREDLETLKMDLPILPIESDKITEAVRKKGVAVLGGKKSNAYNDRGLRQKLYNNLYANLKYNFGVKSYKSIKRSQCDKAIEVIQRYEAPFFLAQQIESVNAQQSLDSEGGAIK